MDRLILLLPSWSAKLLVVRLVRLDATAEASFSALGRLLLLFPFDLPFFSPLAGRPINREEIGDLRQESSFVSDRSLVAVDPGASSAMLRLLMDLARLMLWQPLLCTDGTAAGDGDIVIVDTPAMLIDRHFRRLFLLSFPLDEDKEYCFKSNLPFHSGVATPPVILKLLTDLLFLTLWLPRLCLDEFKCGKTSICSGGMASSSVPFKFLVDLLFLTLRFPLLCLAETDCDDASF